MKWIALAMAPVILAAPYTYPFNPPPPRPTVSFPRLENPFYPRPTTPPTPTTTLTTTQPPVTTPPAPTTLLWEDQFNGNGAVDPSNWGFQIGRWGATSGEQQYYTDSTNNASVNGGSLNITARKERPPDRKGTPNNFTSARVVSIGKQSVTPPVPGSIHQDAAAGGAAPRILVIGPGTGP